MEGLRMIHELEQRMIDRHRWLGISRSEAEKLLAYVNSLEHSMADLLRSVYGQESVQNNRWPPKPAA